MWLWKAEPAERGTWNRGRNINVNNRYSLMQVKHL